MLCQQFLEDGNHLLPFFFSDIQVRMELFHISPEV